MLNQCGSHLPTHHDTTNIHQMIQNDPSSEQKSIFALWLAIFGILAIAFVYSLSSCNTQHRIAKAKTILKDNPKDGAKFCKENWPAKDRFVPGRPVYKAQKIDTIIKPGEVVYINCDTAKNKHIAVICPPERIINIHDTSFVVDTVFQSNTAGNYLIQVKVDSLKTACIKKDGEITTWRKVGISGWGIMLLALLFGVIGRFLKRR